MKILLLCYECSPYVGSEWGVGWGRLLGAAHCAAMVHVVTSAENMLHLQRAQAEGLLPPNVAVHTPLLPAGANQKKRNAGTFAYDYKAYHRWHRKALVLLKELHARERFDLVHQVNVCTFREPGYGHQLGIPYLWGPVGGTQNFPWRFLSAVSMEEALKESCRSLANRWTLRRGRVREAAAAAYALLAANTTNQRDFHRAFQRPVEHLLETGLHEVHEPDRSRFLDRVQRLQGCQPPRPLQLLWSGDFHTRKALPILLRALALLPRAASWRLTVLGDGPRKSAWLREAEMLELSHRVHFAGRLPFQEAVAAMGSADLFCFTSLRDTSGNVVLEALAAGVPVICFDHQGCGDIVDATCGIKLPVTHPRHAYRIWAEALEECLATPGLLLQLSHGATARAREFLWSRNQQPVDALYRQMAGQPGTPQEKDAAEARGAGLQVWAEELEQAPR